MQSLTTWLQGEEAALTDEQFGELAAFADAPPPVVHTPTDDEIDQLVATLAATLKKSAVAHDIGKLKASTYRKMLAAVPLVALQHATREALATMIFMPTPAELLTLAKRHTPPEIALHGKAQGMTRARRQRLFAEAQRTVKDHTANLATLPDRVIKWALMEGFIRSDDEGKLSYRGSRPPSVERPITREEGHFDG